MRTSKLLRTGVVTLAAQAARGARACAPASESGSSQPLVPFVSPTFSSQVQVPSFEELRVKVLKARQLVALRAPARNVARLRDTAPAGRVAASQLNAHPLGCRTAIELLELGGGGIGVGGGGHHGRLGSARRQILMTAFRQRVRRRSAQRTRARARQKNQKERAAPGIEPGTSCTRSRNHTSRPSGQLKAGYKSLLSICW